MTGGRVVVLRGDARALPLPDASVDLLVTSPPYFGLRSYTDGGEHYEGQIGSEATPGEWLAALVACTAEWMRVLKPEGSMFVNLGDKYAGTQPGSYRRDAQPFDHQLGDRSHRLTAQVQREASNVSFGAAPSKCLLGLPWRYALACTDQLGLILRAEIIWAKPNGLPESVTDRVRRAHEQMFHFTRLPRYYSAVDEVREPHESSVVLGMRHNGAAFAANGKVGSADGTRHTDGNPLGKLPGSVWSIPSQPLTVPAHLGVDHFAAFPMELPRRIILGWSPPGVCVACGQSRRPVRGVDWSKVPHTITEKRVKTHAELVAWGRRLREWRTSAGITRREIAALIRPDFATDESATAQLSNWENAYNWPEVRTWERIEAEFNPPAHLGEEVRHTTPVPVSLWEIGDGNGTVTGRHNTPIGGLSSASYQTITGYVCACPTPDAPTRPAVVLDPFGGTGTTALTAAMHGRTGISIDRSADYTRLATWRCNDPGERAKALQVPKPPAVPDGMQPLF